MVMTYYYHLPAPFRWFGKKEEPVQPGYSYIGESLTGRDLVLLFSLSLFLALWRVWAARRRGLPDPHPQQLSSAPRGCLRLRRRRDLPGFACLSVFHLSQSEFKDRNSEREIAREK